MKLAFVAILLCLSLTVGCASTTLNPNGQPIDAFVTQNRAAISATVNLTTAITLKNVKDADRVKVARQAYAVAEGIQQAAKDGRVDPAALDKLSQALLNGIDPAYRAPVGILVSTMQALAFEKINAALATADAQTKAAALTALIEASAEGVKAAASVYTGGTPSLVIGASAADNTGPIRIPALKWQ
jgi:hypothetical protein